MKTKIPEPLTLEHEELHSQLAKAANAGGKTGEAAKVVAQTMHPHFIREEEIALPPLGILTLLAEDKLNDEMKEVIKMTDKLEAELPKMLAEHEEIVAALDKFVKVANEENKSELAAFAEKLKLHAKTEEEVTYPTALLIGKYLKLKIK
jgi:hypothetical protein